MCAQWRARQVNATRPTCKCSTGKNKTESCPPATRSAWHSSSWALMPRDPVRCARDVRISRAPGARVMADSRWTEGSPAGPTFSSFEPRATLGACRPAPRLLGTPLGSRGGCARCYFLPRFAERRFLSFDGLSTTWGSGSLGVRGSSPLSSTKIWLTDARQVGRHQRPPASWSFQDPARGRTPRPDARRGSHFTGTRAGAPLALIRTTRNLAGFVVLTFRPTTWMSMGPS